MHLLRHVTLFLMLNEFYVMSVDEDPCDSFEELRGGLGPGVDEDPLLEEAKSNLEAAIENFVTDCNSIESSEFVYGMAMGVTERIVKAIDRQITITKEEIPPESIKNVKEAILYFNRTGLVDILTKNVAQAYNDIEPLCRNTTKGVNQSRFGVKKRLLFVGPIIAIAVAAAKAAAAKAAVVAAVAASKAAAAAAAAKAAAIVAAKAAAVAAKAAVKVAANAAIRASAKAAANVASKAAAKAAVRSLASKSAKVAVNLLKHQLKPSVIAEHMFIGGAGFGIGAYKGYQNCCTKKF